MKNTTCVLLLLFAATICNAQSSIVLTPIEVKMSRLPINSAKSIDLIAKYISNNFDTDNDKIKAAFYFTASTINYDVERFKKITQNGVAPNAETAQDRIAYSLNYKKGVCANYADVFAAIANNLKIKTYIIAGYTRQLGKVVNFSHAWCATNIDGHWFIIDPTWGSGYLNNMVFTKKLDYQYFTMKPQMAVKSHMPFDYLWQFLNYPITNNEFVNNTLVINKNKLFFDFEAAIVNHDNATAAQRNLVAAERIEQNGLINNMVASYYNEIKATTIFDNLNAIGQEYNLAVTQYNNYVSFRNKQFKPAIADIDLMNMIQKPFDKLVNCQQKLLQITASDNQNIENIKGLQQSIDALTKPLAEQIVFVTEYIGKSKIGRKLMFNKVTFLGAKLN